MILLGNDILQTIADNLREQLHTSQFLPAFMLISYSLSSTGNQNVSGKVYICLNDLQSTIQPGKLTPAKQDTAV